MEQAYLIKLNDSLEKVIEKLDRQTVQIQDLTNKVDFYREAQHEQGKKLNETEKTAADALASTKAAHKRMDEFKNSVIDLEETIEGLEKAFEEYLKAQKEKEIQEAKDREKERKALEKERQENAKWIKRAIITAVLGWSTALIGFLLNNIFGG